MADVKPPFVLVEGLDVAVFASLTELTGHVEAQDVREAVYEAFDADGRIVVLWAESDRGPVLAVPGDPAATRLRDLLLASLAAAGRSERSAPPTDDGLLEPLIQLFLQPPRRSPCP